ncbi:MAG: tRNA (N(6)-L-threonylcarbamoyladenosine(37)-C(2))-methylthiotransferase MtaB [Lachnospiraceae bacterium]|nr:tRNA (N(6)-L-threonylcarbamoyladenosine(37)-C(2))-methylthiotransferase MtaB [Lachnospiraceae bacterium]
MSTALDNKKIAIYTLGCKVNQYESDSMEGLLKDAGCEIVSFDDYADAVIINTCSVTNIAERKSRQIIHRAKKKNPEAVIVACGCYVQSGKEELENDNSVDIIIGNNRKKDVARILEDYFTDIQISDNYIDINATSEYESMTVNKPTEHTRAYVKVQDGCNNFCTYCIIPYARGRVRSKALHDVLTEIDGLAHKGIKEIVITGINLPSYQDNNGNTLIDLLVAAAKTDGIERIRMGSLEPRVITEDFLNVISKEDKICPHFHLSLQSACNDTLKRMNRKYTIEEYMEKCNLIRKYYVNPAITTDVIVGFPGETDEEFATTCDNLEKLNLYEMHIFKYSKRKGTPAATMPCQVDDAVKEERSNRLLEMTRRHKANYEALFTGKNLNVLVEEYVCEDGRYYIKGHTERYIYVKKEFDEEFCKNHINEFVEVEI